MLRRVITSLTEKKKTEGFIPYRESKLTQLLKQSLGGNSYTLMIACLSPSDRYYEENLSTLQYAAKASQISNIPTKNIDPRMLLLADQKQKLGSLEKELRSANQHIQNLSILQEEKEGQIDKLVRKCTKLEQKNDVLAETNAQWAQQSKPGDFSRPDTHGLPFIVKGTAEDLTSPADFNMSAAAMTGQDFHTKQEAQAERLIHSVNAVTDLLKANTELRDRFESIQRKLEDKDQENTQLHIEN